MTIFLILLLIIPLLMGLGAILLKKKPYIFTYLACSVSVYGILTLLCFYFLWDVLFHGQIFSLGNFVFLNQTNAIFATLITSLAFVINLFAVPYFKKEVEDKVIGFGRLKEYVIFIQMFIFAMLFTALSNNLILSWVGLEATTIFTTFLISFNNTEKSREAAWKYVIICSIGLMVGLFGLFLMLYSGLPSLNLNTLLTTGIDIAQTNIGLLKFALIFIMVGFGTKAALFPMNTWLPDAHGKAPSPVSAFMSAILLPLALYVIFRVKEIMDLAMPGIASQILLIFGIVTLLFSGIVLLKQGHYKRALAYSSSEHMGIIAIAIAINAPYIAFAHIIFHSFIKAASFMSAGNVLISLSSGQFDKIRNLFKHMKFTPILLIVALIFLMGIPPSYLFFTEIALIIQGFAHNLWIGIAVSLGILLATAGLMINFGKMFKDEPTDHPLAKVEDDFKWNGRHTAIVITLLFPLLFVAIAIIGISTTLQ